MSSDLFKKYFPDDVHHQFGMHLELQKWLPAKGCILDLGCGGNTDLTVYRSAEREVWGTDFQAHANLQFPEWFRLLGPDGRIPFPDSTFDVVASNMVMEHVKSPTAYLREISRVLRPGGVFVGHTISGSHYVAWIRRLIGFAPHSFNQWLVRRLYGRPEVDTFPAYYRLNRQSQIEFACRKSSLRLVGIQRYADPWYFSFSQFTLTTAILTDRLLASLVSGWGRLYLTATLTKPESIDLNNLLPLPRSTQPIEDRRLTDVA